VKKGILSVLTVFIFQFAFGQIPAGYYDSATGTEYTLKTQLYNIIKDHSSVSYTPGIWNAFYTTDDRADGKVWDTYSNCDFTFGTDQDAGSGGTSECQYYNREHSFPRYWFGGEVDPMNTDLFHIMPTDKYVNNRRGNLEYGEVSTPTETFDNGSKIGPNTFGSYTGTVFEPIDEYKGDFARNYFYMATRYENLIQNWPGCAMLDGSSNKCFSDWALDMLKEWHINDPVSQKEIDRNNAVYAIQDNRNPFIDHPEFVASIWGGEVINSTPDILSLKNNIKIYPNPVKDNLTLNFFSEYKNVTVTIYNMIGVIVRQESFNEVKGEVNLNLLNNLEGIYLLQIKTNDKQHIKKIVINN